MGEQQLIPARHGTATFVPAGQIIKIINTSGSQVIDTWAFALPKPEAKKGSQEQKTGQDDQETKRDESKQNTSKSAPAKNKKDGNNLPTQEEAEQVTEQGMQQGEEVSKDAKGAAQQKNTWGSYVPSVHIPTFRKAGTKGATQETEQQKDSKTWASYFPSGKGFGNYVPKAATDTASNFASYHQRDSNKSYLEQLQDFSKTPVGAAGWSGIAALSGSGYGGSLYSGYQAYSAKSAEAPAMEYMSMPHCRAATLHLRPKVNDTLVSNLREPILTLIEDTSPGIHDTLIAACDPPRYKQLGAENWLEHGSCAENLVLALGELNSRAGLKGNKGVGADVTINSVPAPLNLFMNIPWDDEGDIGFHAPKGKEGDFVRLKAERDIVVVMSACPQDILEINNKAPTDAHFIVEGNEDTTPAIKRTQYRKRPPPRKLSSSHATSTIDSRAGITPYKKPVPQRRTVPAKKPSETPSAQTAQTNAQPAREDQSAIEAQPTKEAQPAKAAQPAQAAKPDENGSSTAQQAPKKKFVPKKIAPAKKEPSAPSGAANNANTANAANGDAPPAEKKKPRKLAPRAKPAVPAES